MGEIRRAAGYIRVSTAEQSTKGLSIETQISEIEAYAKQHNMRLEGMYIDRGITARKSLDKRVEFMRMMGDVQSGKINHIIVLRLDRFFRNVYDYHRMMNEYLTPNKCDWSAVKEQYTTTTTNGRLMINLRLSIAEQECDTDSDRIKDVFENRVNQGYAIFGSLHMGLKVVDHRVVRDPETTHIVEDMFSKMESCNSVKKTLLYINEKYNLRICYNTLRNMLRDRLYIGEYRNNKNYCEPTITEERFENIQRLLKMNVKERKNNMLYIFSGLIVCDSCGTKMVGIYTYGGTEKKQYKYYRCNKYKVSRLCDNSQVVNEKHLERFLLENVERYMIDTLNEEKAIMKAREKQMKSQKSNRDAIEKKLKRLKELYVDGFIDMEQYKIDYADLKSKIIDPPAEEKKDLTAINNFLQQGDWKSMYSKLTEEKKQALWRTIIKEIRMSGKEVVGIKFL